MGLLPLFSQGGIHCAPFLDRPLREREWRLSPESRYGRGRSGGSAERRKLLGKGGRRWEGSGESGRKADLFVEENGGFLPKAATRV
jgi:hypothetical protein